MIINKKFKNALNNISQKTPPIWFMRQAGRYHNHYQSLRKKYKFVELCKQPELAAEVACGPITDFDYDVAILFSDILFPLQSLGLELNYSPGPVFGNYLNDQLLNNLKPISDILDDLSFQKEALNITRDMLPNNKSLVGFVGGPWTLLSYGSGIKNEVSVPDIEENKFYERALYEVLIPLTKQTIEIQLNNNAEIVYIFDTNARQMADKYFMEKYIKIVHEEIFQSFPNKVAYFRKENPLLKIKDSNKIYSMAGMVYGNSTGLVNALKEKTSGFLQGNFSPESLLKPHHEFKLDFEQFKNSLLSLTSEERSGWVCSLNHGVLPKSSEHNVKYFVDNIRQSFQ
tara:strand:- start:131 stop:1156 length:1026 start_codon:yes stop_codon:yes gene_type:complete